MSIYRGVPPKNHNLISDKLQKWGDSYHKMDPSDYKEGLLVLSSHDYDQLYEAEDERGIVFRDDLYGKIFGTWIDV